MQANSDKTLHIKNMVCDRCIMVVEDVLKNQKIPFTQVKLGDVQLEREITPAEKDKLSHSLHSIGFELLESRINILVEKIKTLIIQQIQYDQEKSPINLSTYLSQNLNTDYSLLSNTFSQAENMTIEQFAILQKIEKVKELLSYDQATLTEIAYNMGYKSVAYLSSQFKKYTGISPTQYKNNQAITRKPLDKV